MIGKLLIAGQYYDFASLDSTLLTNNNYRDIIKSKDIIDCCTSIEDLGLAWEDINCEVYDHIKTTIKVLPGAIADHEVHYIYPLSNLDSGKVENIDYINRIIIDYNTDLLLAKRPTEDPVVWVAGCSFSVGLGVDSNQRWGYHVSEYFNQPEVNIAQSGASATFAADQILRSNIKKGDKVIWGLTSLVRVDHIVETGVYRSVVFNSAKKSNTFELYTVDYFDSLTQQIQYVKAVRQVMNFCNLIGASLYIVNLLCGNKTVTNYLSQFPNYVDLTGEFIDVGYTDHKHPGPLQHQAYAKDIITFIQGEQV